MVTSLAGSNPLATVNYDNLNGLRVTATSGMAAGGHVTAGKNLSFNWLLGALDKKGYSDIITKPNVLVQNHSIGYISVLDTQPYIKSYTTVENGTTGSITKTPQVAEYQEGVDFYVKVDKFPNKNFIQVSVVPSVKSVEVGPAQRITDSQGDTIITPRTKEISTFSVANIKSGDIIVLSGFKKKNTSKDLSSPLAGKAPVVGDLFNSESKNAGYTEFVFLIKVNQINRASNTFNIPSGKAKSLYRNFQ